MYKEIHIYMYMYVCICTYKHNRMYNTYIYICRLASRLLCIFYPECRSFSLFATHLVLWKQSDKGPTCFPRFWNLGIKVWNWNLGGGALQLGYNCIPAPLLHTHGRMHTTETMHVCPWYIGMYVYMCKYIYIAWLRKPWDFIWVPYLNPTILEVIGLVFLNQVPTLSINQPIYRPTCLSMYLTIHIYIYACICIYICTYTYIYIHI